MLFHPSTLNSRRYVLVLHFYTLVLGIGASNLLFPLDATFGVLFTFGTIISSPTPSISATTTVTSAINTTTTKKNAVTTTSISKLWNESYYSVTYKEMVVQARCQARCNAKYGRQKQASPHEFSDLYRPFVCAWHPAVCRECSAACNTSIVNVDDCASSCKTDVCQESCSFFNQTLYEEAESEDIIIATDLPPNIKENTLTKPTSACLYTPTPEDVNSERSTIVLKWNVLGSNGKVTSYPLSFIIELKEETKDGRRFPWEPLGYTNFSIIPITMLDHTSKFKFRVSCVSQSGFIAKPAESEWISLPQAGRPHPPQNVTISQQYVRGHSVRAEVQWQTPNNVGCYFKLYWMTPKEGSFHSRELREWVGYKYELSNLAFDGNYKLEIQTYDRYFRTPSKKVTVEFRTLGCLESTNNNYHSCGPDPPSNFDFEVHSPYDVNGSLFTDVTLTWGPPKHVSWHNTIDKYIIKWRKNPDIRYIKLIKPDRGVVELDGSTTNWTMRDVHWDAEYIMTIAAESEGGSGQPSRAKIVTGKGYSKLVALPSEATYTPETSRTPSSVYYATIIPAALAAAAVSICVFYYIKLRRNVRHMGARECPRKEEINPLYEYTMSSSSRDNEPLLITDEYEVDYSHLKFTDTLGEGAFGKVFKADFTPPGTYQSRTSATSTVAVKMLKEHATPEERRFLLLEISAMKTLGNHPNLVSILACVTTVNRPCLIMDYCPLGDLRNFLRQHRTQIQYLPAASLGSFSSSFATNINLTGSTNSSSLGLSSHSSKKQGSLDHVPNEQLSQTTLLSYARQIAVGMEYLNQNRFIHRDLASRNILMPSHQVVKISDFGLSRDVYETNMYQPTSARKLPYKWMPIESIFDQIFTIKSDVWSYGILLWEIVTLGGCPYPGIPNIDLFRLLNEGYRLERPSNCSLDIYKIMLSCWHPRPDDRPSFTQLKKKIESLLEATCSYIDLTMEVSADYYKNDSSDQEAMDSITNQKPRDCNSGKTMFVNLPLKDTSLDFKSSHGSQDNSTRSNKRYTRLDASSTLPMNRNFAQVCAHYPVSKGPYVLESNEPVPGLSEELLEKTLSSSELLPAAVLGVGGMSSKDSAVGFDASLSSNQGNSSHKAQHSMNTPKVHSVQLKQTTAKPHSEDTPKSQPPTLISRKGDRFGMDCVFPSKDTIPVIPRHPHASDRPEEIQIIVPESDAQKENLASAKRPNNDHYHPQPSVDNPSYSTITAAKTNDISTLPSNSEGKVNCNESESTSSNVVGLPYTPGSSSHTPAVLQVANES